MVVILTLLHLQRETYINLLTEVNALERILCFYCQRNFLSIGMLNDSSVLSIYR